MTGPPPVPVRRPGRGRRALSDGPPGSGRGAAAPPRRRRRRRSPVAAARHRERPAIADPDAAPARQQPAGPAQRPLRPPDGDGQHGGAGAADQESRAGLGRPHPTPLRAVSLDEEEEPPASQQVEADPQRPAVGASPIHREAVAAGEPPGDRSGAEELPLGHGEEGPREERPHDQRVPVADVVGGDEERPARGHARHPLEAEPAVEQRAQTGADHRRGHPVAPRPAAVIADGEPGGKAGHRGGHPKMVRHPAGPPGVAETAGIMRSEPPP